MRYGVTLLVALISALAIGASPASAYRFPGLAMCEGSAPVCGGVSDDGSRFIFGTDRQLVPEDVNGNRDVYQRFEGQTKLISTYPDGTPIHQGADLLGMSSDGTRVFFETQASLTPDDVDDFDHREFFWDIYEWHNGQITLISAHYPGLDLMGDPHPASYAAEFAGNSEDGRHVFFNSYAHYAPPDPDNHQDVFERYGDTTYLVSTGPGDDSGTLQPPLGELSRFLSSTPDGSHAFFQSSMDLAGKTGPSDGLFDRYHGQTTWLNPLPSDYPVDHPRWGGSTPDGSHVYFSSERKLTADDQDEHMDLYQRYGDTYKLISGPSPTDADCGDAYGDCYALFGGVSDDGSKVVFETDQRLDPSDTDSSIDLYERSGDQFTLLSTGPQGGNGPFNAFTDAVSSDGSKVVFHTKERLVSADEDDQSDVYEWDDGTTRLISTGPFSKSADLPAVWAGGWGDFDVISFRTAEALVRSDTDKLGDIYARTVGTDTTTAAARASASAASGAQTRLISKEAIPPRVTIGPRRAAVSNGLAHLRIGCPKAEQHGPCHGWLHLMRNGARVGSATFRVSSGSSRGVDVQLSNPARHQLGNGPITVRAKARGKDAFGNAKTVRRRVILSRS